jgi:hypothetical protein
MTRGTILDISFVLLLVSLPVISFGTVREVPALWGIGLALLVTGFLIPLLLRYIPVRTEPEDEPDVFEEPS